ncbi:MAG: hypothetical protein NTW28_05715 [Candidatus Solibacter sp.]|nr:hypothetical protein [Candidatus Solibacter sp.]
MQSGILTCIIALASSYKKVYMSASTGSRPMFFGVYDATSQRHCRSQFEVLKAEYETLFNSPSLSFQEGHTGPAPATPLSPDARIAKEIIDRHLGSKDPETAPETLKWHDVLEFHRCLLSMLPLPDLKRAAWALRERYRETFGEIEYTHYLASKPPDLNEPTISRDDLLADLNQLLVLTYGSYEMGPENSLLLRRRVKATMITIGVVLAAFGFLLYFFSEHYGKGDYPMGATMLTVGFAGALGGFVSVLQRLRQLGGSGDALTDYHGIQSERFTTIVAAGLMGFLFAGVMYLLFAAKLVEGSLFPDLGPKADSQSSAIVQPVSTAAAPEGSVATKEVPPAAEVPKPAKPGVSVYNFLSERRPQESKDVALLIIWAFLAGFIERLVPDNLSRLLAKKAELQST